MGGAGSAPEVYLRWNLQAYKAQALITTQQSLYKEITKTLEDSACRPCVCHLWFKCFIERPMAGTTVPQWPGGWLLSGILGYLQVKGTLPSRARPAAIPEYVGTGQVGVGLSLCSSVGWLRPDTSDLGWTYSVKCLKGPGCSFPSAHISFWLRTSRQS